MVLKNMAKGNIFIYDLITRFGAICDISLHNWNIIDVDISNAATIAH